MKWQEYKWQEYKYWERIHDEFFSETICDLSLETKVLMTIYFARHMTAKRQHNVILDHDPIKRLDELEDIVISGKKGTFIDNKSLYSSAFETDVARYAFNAVNYFYSTDRLHGVIYSLFYCLIHQDSVSSTNKLLSLFVPQEWNESYHTSTTTSLAKTIYDTKDWSLCPILADALMDAGCEADHYVIWLLRKKYRCFGRGVWILNKLIGKESVVLQTDKM